MHLYHSLAKNRCCGTFEISGCTKVNQKTLPLRHSIFIKIKDFKCPCTKLWIFFLFFVSHHGKRPAQLKNPNSPLNTVEGVASKNHLGHEIRDDLLKPGWLEAVLDVLEVSLVGREELVHAQLQPGLLQETDNRGRALVTLTYWNLGASL